MQPPSLTIDALWASSEYPGGVELALNLSVVVSENPEAVVNQARYSRTGVVPTPGQLAKVSAHATRMNLSVLGSPSKSAVSSYVAAGAANPKTSLKKSQRKFRPNVYWVK